MSELQVSSLDQLTAEILVYKQQTAQNIIEIGKRLLEAKEKLPHGEWGRWLEEKVDFKRETARKFMHAAETFGNSQALGNLSQTKVFALLDLPQEERQEFMENNPISDMTTRELQEAIKARRKAEQEVDEFLKKNFELRRQIKKLREEKPEVTVIEKEIIKEVVSQEDKRRLSAYEMEIKRLAQEKRDALEKLKEIESGHNVDELRKKKERLELEKHVSIFELQIKIQNFLKEASPGIFLQGAIAASDPQQRKDILKSIESLKAYTRALEEVVLAEYELIEG